MTRPALVRIPDRRARRADRPVTLGAQDPQRRRDPLQITGDPATRFSLVVLGDGYLASEQAKFRAHSIGT